MPARNEGIPNDPRKFTCDQNSHANHVRLPNKAVKRLDIYEYIAVLHGAMNTKIVSLRIPAVLASRLGKVTDKAKKPLAPTATAIILRGLELALREIERK